MKRRPVLVFRVPAERRIKALFTNEPDVWADLERLGTRLPAVLGELYRRAPDRAVDVVRSISTIVLNELERAIRNETTRDV